MSISQKSYNACKQFKGMGVNGFCFKQNKTLPLNSEICDAFSPKIKSEPIKKRIFTDEKKRKTSGDFEENVIEFNPDRVSASGLNIPKIDTLKEGVFIDVESKEKDVLREQNPIIDNPNLPLIFIFVVVIIIVIFLLTAL